MALLMLVPQTSRRVISSWSAETGVRLVYRGLDVTPDRSHLARLDGTDVVIGVRR